MVWLTLLTIPAAWLYMNHFYGKVYGAKLRWPYLWAAHGALLWGFRIKRWER